MVRRKISIQVGEEAPRSGNWRDACNAPSNYASGRNDALIETINCIDELAMYCLVGAANAGALIKRNAKGSAARNLKVDDDRQGILDTRLGFSVGAILLGVSR